MSAADRPSPTTPPSTPPNPDKVPSGAVLDKESLAILNCVRGLCKGESALTDKSAEGNLQFCVPPTQWVEVRNAISSGQLGLWARDKLHYTYEPEKERLTLQMAGPLHETYVEGLRALILAKLAALRDHTPADVANAIASIASAGSPQLALGPVCSRNPDLSFRSPTYPPALVAEIGVSQDGEEFPAIAEQYVFLSRGRIRTFFGVNIEYRSPSERKDNTLPQRQAWFSIFRLTREWGTAGTAGTASLTRVEARFHDKDGVLTPDATLHLLLSDFFTANRPDLNTYGISITHKELANLLADAEAVQADVDKGVESAQSSFDCEWTYNKRPL